MTAPRQPLDLAAIRARLDAVQGPEYWRCLEELAQTEGFEELLEREFPRQAGEWTDPVSRRRFLGLMGASLALAGLSGCAAAPSEKIMPYVRQPEGLVPGKPLWFATAMPLAGYGSGLLVESHEGRPTKVEGNPDHPTGRKPGNSPAKAAFGPADAFAQASILTLYDPDRSQSVRHLGDIRGWDTFTAEVTAAFAHKKPEQVRLRILMETVTSPSLAHQIRRVLRAFKQARWHQYEPVGRDNIRAGASLIFGRDVATRYRFDRADVILALGADFLACGPGHLRYARDFSDRRRVGKGRPNTMNRLYVVESTPSITGAKADYRAPLKAGHIEGFVRALAPRLGVELPEGGDSTHGVEWFDALVSDLEKNHGRSIILAGDDQPPAVHAIVHALNQKLENTGRTVLHTAPVEAEPVDENRSLRDLVAAMEKGQVDILLILGGNPVYTAPADLRFGERLLRLAGRSKDGDRKLFIHLGLYDDETSALCHWHVPEAHYLESWGDVRAFDGTVSVIQPLIAPLYGGRTAYEVLALFTDQPERTSYDVVRAYWRNALFSREPAAGYEGVADAWKGSEAARRATGGFDAWWRRALHAGLIAGTELPPLTDLRFQTDWAGKLRTGSGGRGLEIIFRPDPAVFDGRFANNGWLQELPRPLTKLTWDNVALLSPATAEERKLNTGDVVELRYNRRVVQAPVWILPGHADHSVTVQLGYGRTRAGKVGNKVGFDAYALRTSQAPYFDDRLEVHSTGRTYPLASTQTEQRMQGRDLIRAGTLAEYRRDEHFAQTPQPPGRKSLTLYTERKYDGYKWGMTIDLNSCTGCSACVVACQAENNIPVVGKDQVSRGRHMHWLRVDNYFKGGLTNPEAYFQPVPCMQCENAPCELVCPVAATVHSSEGLNDMVYNRCVGTRYCSNNCPYKVRRFNFLAYADYATESLKLGRNPEVTVRSRGVMEKCTYCVQRISRARIEAEKEDRRVADGEIQTACQAACPAGAIIFGDLNDNKSVVTRLHNDPRNYALLEELNTRPRTTYLAALKNPHSTEQGGKAP
jgi:molybdopterin-containing oxidoreductase family iron-sulfur binding subunit